MVKTDPDQITPSDFVRELVVAAINERASDVHIEPLEKELRIRFRVDGRLQEKLKKPYYELEPVLNRVKVLGNLDITSHNTPQDGHFIISWGNKPIDVRISIFPTVNGEAIVMRLLNREEMLIPLKDLGMNPEILATVRSLVTKNYGMVLVTGPSGSGKTTTLYSVLQEIKSKEKNIITLEDPVEYHLDEIRQTKINPDQGLTFAEGMKSVLRQDPDAVMIGEIRDHETAEHAIRAALSGRIVFSTVHSNSSVGTIARLIDMEIERSLVAYALNGVIAQRLVGKLCQSCKRAYTPAHSHLKLLGIEKLGEQFYRGEGCEACHGTGYKGRVGIFEVLEFDNDLRALIVDKAHMEKLEEYVSQTGLRTLKQDALEKLRAGLTTVEEIIKVI